MGDFVAELVYERGDDKNCKINEMAAGCKKAESSPHYNEIALPVNEISRGGVFFSRGLFIGLRRFTD